ncbi:hypothetical protein AB0N06_26850 [Streptomyces sp. NPDC051020]|uniref:hypothetical protein n=1 Tax=Streptomyces sp. NPDC051020 TaxID=3155409 RepID=UPI00342DB773
MHIATAKDSLAAEFDRDPTVPELAEQLIAPRTMRLAGVGATERKARAPVATGDGQSSSFSAGRPA